MFVLAKAERETNNPPFDVYTLKRILNFEL